MKRSTLRSLSLFLLPIAFAACADEPIAPEASLAPAFARNASDEPGRYLVVFRSVGSEPAGFRADVERLGGTVEHSLSAAGAMVVGNLRGSAAAKLARAAGVQSIDRDPVIPMRTTRITATEGLMAEVLDVETASPTSPQSAGLFVYQWNMRAISAPQAWAAGKRGSSGVKVAILDTGIDEGNPAVGARRNIDLEGLVDRELSRSFMPVEDVVTTALFPGAPLYTDLDGHGTNVASQVSSRAWNLAGVTSETRLIAVKVCTILPPPATPANPNPDPGYCGGAAIFAGFQYAVDAGADVINMSLGGGFLKSSCTGCVSVYNRLMNYANQRGVTVVVAAGNDGIDLDHSKYFYSTYCDAIHVICVAATGAPASGPSFTGPFDSPDAPSIYSNFGRSAIDVSAPGGNYTIGLIGEGEEAEVGIVGISYVWSLCPRRTAAVYVPELSAALPFGGCGLWGFAGTSQASPHVAGLAAMLVAAHGRNPDLIRDLMTESADQLGSSDNDPRYGRGRINVARAVGAL